MRKLKAGAGTTNRDPFYDVAVIGGGIVGLAAAMALGGRRGISLVVLEAEPRLAVHQTGRNSGVVHSGLYYRPGSLKARNCVAGREALYRFCEENEIPFRRCGKIVVAVSERETTRLDELERRGRANGLTNLRRLGPEQIRECEPHATGRAALHAPDTGIVDFAEVARAFARKVESTGGEIRTGEAFRRLRRDANGLILETTRGEIRCRNLINCAGLFADRVARRCGVEPGLRIVPFRGEYFTLAPEREHLVRNLIYPTPDPRFPFLGVHFTRRIDGTVEAGPNAVLAFKRTGYGKFDFSPRDFFSSLAWPGFWRMTRRHWRRAVGEYRRSFSRRKFAEDLQRLVPEVRAEDLRPGGAGVRAQALDRDGTLADDFRIEQTANMIHVLNAPSPAATASIAIGETIAAMAAKNFGLDFK